MSLRDGIQDIMLYLDVVYVILYGAVSSVLQVEKLQISLSDTEMYRSREKWSCRGNAGSDLD